MATDYLKLHEFLATEVVDVDKINDNNGKIDGYLMDKDSQIMSDLGVVLTAVSIDSKRYDYKIWKPLPIGKYRIKNNGVKASIIGARKDGTALSFGNLNNGQYSDIEVTEDFDTFGFFASASGDVNFIVFGQIPFDISYNLSSVSNFNRDNIGFIDTAVSTGGYDYDIWGEVKKGILTITNVGDVRISYVLVIGGTNKSVITLSAGATGIVTVEEDADTSGYYSYGEGNVGVKVIRKTPEVPSEVGTKIMTFGDSITAEPSYYLTNLINKTGYTLVENYAVSGAKLINLADTAMDGNPVTSNQNSNTIPNQVTKMLAESVDTPDIVLIFASTNDQMEGFGFIEEMYQVDGSFVDVDLLDLTKQSGSMRWIVEKIKGKFPLVKIYFCTPIQSATGGIRTFSSLTTKSDFIIQNCERMSVPVIDLFRNSGIYERFEINNGNGVYLKDGLHPNSSGGTVIADYIAKKLISG